MTIPRILCTAAALSLLAACAGEEVKRPTNELANATQAMERARQANAYEFASFDITAAERKLDRARDLANSDENDDRLEAQHLAEQVVLDARLAESKARLAQTEAIKSEMEQAIEQLSKDAGGAP